VLKMAGFDRGHRGAETLWAGSVTAVDREISMYH
jgi:hypothetical protein